MVGQILLTVIFSFMSLMIGYYMGKDVARDEKTKGEDK